MNNWFVFTGGPYSGKTTTLNFLSKKGYKIAHETAQEYIDMELGKGISVEEMRANPSKFQLNIWKAQVALEDSLNSRELVFLDRALPDSVGYHKFLGIKCPDFMIDRVRNTKYKAAFLFTNLPYPDSSVRAEDQKQSKAIAKVLENTYKSLNIPVIKIPVMRKKERVEFILNKIKEL